MRASCTKGGWINIIGSTSKLINSDKVDNAPVISLLSLLIAITLSISSSLFFLKKIVQRIFETS